MLTLTYDLDDGYEISRSRDSKGKNILEVIDDYTALDLETTGLDPRYDSIIEIGLIRVRNGEIVDRFVSLVNPEDEIGSFITELTGITDEMLATAPTLEQILPDALAFIGQDTLVAHNANFDINFIYDACSLLSLPLFTNNFIDTMRISRRALPGLPHHRLKDMVKHFGISNSVHHRAMGDAEAAHMCYSHLKQYILENNINLSPKKHAQKIQASDITTDKNQFDEDSPVFGKVFVFTGALEKMIRKDAMQMVVDLGGMCGDRVTKKTNYLVLGNNDYCSSIKDGKSIKQKKAEELKLSGYDVEILSEDVFYDMISI